MKMSLKQSQGVNAKRSAGTRLSASSRYLALALVLLLSLTQMGVAQDKQKSDMASTAGGAQNANAPTGSQKPATSRPNPGSNVAAPADAGTDGAQRFVRDGVAVEFQIQPISSGERKAGALVEGEDATVRFKITDATTGSAVSGIHPSAWIDGHDGEGNVADEKQCREKVQSFLQGSMSTSPDMDLNAYYILALNQEANISVIDPLRGFGSTKLYTLVFLKSPGEDWVMSKDGRLLYVSMPQANAVAVVDTALWKVIDNIDVGLRPMRLAMQADEKYLWVGVDSPPGAKSGGGVTVIDTAARKALTNVPTGEGRHEIVVTPDNRFAFVSNPSDGTLAIIEVGKLAKVKTLKTGTRPSAIAFSPLSKSLYVTDEADGTVTVVGGESWETRARIQTNPGLTAISFGAGGRWGFVINQKESVVEVFDAATNRRLHAVPVEKSPDQITFTDQFAYVHSLGSENISLIRLGDLDTAKQVSVTKFPGGMVAPDKSPYRTTAAQMTAAPEANSLLIANPADQQIYYYMEGMTAPSGSFQNYQRVPKGVLVVDRSLHETTTGVYSTQVRLDGSGRFDVAFLSDSPRVVNCFSLQVKANPAEHTPLPIKVELLINDRKLTAGQTTRLRFKVLDGDSEQPKDGLKDLGVLTFLSPGNWQERQWARSLGGGIYEVEITPPQSGVYYLFVQCPSLKLGYKQLPSMILQAVNEKASPDASLKTVSNQ
jgi:YVTN family beta-propeller protein